MGYWCLYLLDSGTDCLIQICDEVPMTFETYDKDKHTLEVGTKIRLAGREGVITEEPGSLYWFTAWDNGNPEHIDLRAFPLLEIAVSPLTIDKRVKEAIKDHLFWAVSFEAFKKRMDVYLNSLEET